MPLALWMYGPDSSPAGRAADRDEGKTLLDLICLPQSIWGLHHLKNALFILIDLLSFIK